MPSSERSSPPSGTTLERAFRTLVRVLDARRAPYAIIGGIATIQHTRLRTTDDIDALLSVPQIGMPLSWWACTARD